MSSSSRILTRARLLLCTACSLAAGPAWAQAVPADPATQAARLRAEAEAHEHGNGVPRDGERAAQLYCEAARLGDAVSLFNLGWMYANGRGVGRDDAQAAWFFHAAAERGGFPQAWRMLPAVGEPSAQTPECLRRPAPPRVAAAPATARPPAPAIPPGAPAQVVKLVQQLAPRFQVPEALAFAIIAAESNFDPLARSPRNAMGLMQLIPATAERFNVTDPFDPGQNLRGGLAYLRWLLAYFEGEVALVAAAYNAGKGMVERHRGVPPFPETRAYVQRILATVGVSRYPYDARVTPPSPRMAQIRQVAGL